MRVRVSILVFALIAITVPLCAGDSNLLPVSTKSAKAAELYQQGVKLEQAVHTAEAAAKFREAVTADPKFALAWAMLANSEPDPAAAANARIKAFSLMSSVTEGEQMMIRWIVSRGESDLISAIAAANDLTSNFPKDPYVLWLVGTWYPQMNEWGRDIALQEKVIALDPNFAASYNDLGYGYAEERNFEKAVASMEKYAALLPNEPNTQDSYAEILRLSGKYEDALTHYRKALEMDPKFYSSQQGLGDTYAIMGDQEKARAEYAKCLNLKEASRESLLCRQMNAYTWIRENKLAEARKYLDEFIATMHKEGQTVYEVEAMQALAFIAPDANSAIAELDRAATEIQADKNVPKVNRLEITARIYAHKVRVAALAGDKNLGQKAMQQLDQFVNDSPDPMMQAALKGGHGAWFYGLKRYEEAVSDLQDDQNNPFSKMLLAKCYEAMGKHKEADEVRQSLLTLRRLEIDLWMAQQSVKAS